MDINYTPIVPSSYTHYNKRNNAQRWTMDKKYIPQLGAAIMSLAIAVLGITIPKTPWIDENKAIYISIVAMTALLTGLFLWYFGNKYISSKENTDSSTNLKKEQAVRLHSDFIERDKDFWHELENMPENASAKDNSDVKRAIHNIELVTNDLATIINKDEFDKFIENVLNLYHRYSMFHFNSGQHSVGVMRNRINRKIRAYIRKVK